MLPGRSPAPAASWLHASFHNVCAVVGAGVLGLPHAFSYLGCAPPQLLCRISESAWWLVHAEHSRSVLLAPSCCAQPRHPAGLTCPCSWPSHLFPDFPFPAAGAAG